MNVECKQFNKLVLCDTSEWLGLRTKTFTVQWDGNSQQDDEWSQQQDSSNHHRRHSVEHGCAGSERQCLLSERRDIIMKSLQKTVSTGHQAGPRSESLTLWRRKHTYIADDFRSHRRRRRERKLCSWTNVDGSGMFGYNDLDSVIVTSVMLSSRCHHRRRPHTHSAICCVVSVHADAPCRSSMLRRLVWTVSCKNQCNSIL